MALAASHKAHQVDVNRHISKCDARRLYETGEGNLGTADEAVVLEILSKRSIPQLKQTFLSYKHIYGHDYTKVPTKEYAIQCIAVKGFEINCLQCTVFQSVNRGNYGQFGKALVLVVKCICNPAHYYAKVSLFFSYFIIRLRFSPQKIIIWLSFFLLSSFTLWYDIKWIIDSLKKKIVIY